MLMASFLLQLSHLEAENYHIPRPFTCQNITQYKFSSVKKCRDNDKNQQDKAILLKQLVPRSFLCSKAKLST